MVTQKELTDRITEALDGLGTGWPVVSADDYQEARQDGMIVVGLAQRQQANVGLDDYFWIFQILCDVRIQENAPQLSELAEPVSQWISRVTARGFDFSQVFQGLPVVGVFVESQASWQLAAGSRQAVFSIRVVTSQN